MSLEAVSREVYRLLKEGIPISVLERNSTPGHTSSGLRPAEPRSGNSPQRGEGKGGQTTVRVQVIDWEQPANHDFLLVSQFSVTGALYTCRPDLVGFVNGLPLVVIERKKLGVPARAAFDENLTHYKAEITQLFWFNALLIASNGTDSRVGSLTADWERCFEWKRIERDAQRLDHHIRGLVGLAGFDLSIPKCRNVARHEPGQVASGFVAQVRQEGFNHVCVTPGRAFGSGEFLGFNPLADEGRGVGSVERFLVGGLVDFAHYLQRLNPGQCAAPGKIGRALPAGRHSLRTLTL